jgi:hypothetical protein
MNSPLVHAAPGEALGDRLPLGDHLIDCPTEVREAGVHHGASLLEGLRSGAHEHSAEVQRAIRGDNLIGDIQVTGVDLILVESVHEGLVLFGGHGSFSFQYATPGPMLATIAAKAH